MTKKEEKRRERSERRALQTRPSQPRVPEGPPEAEAEDKDKDKSFIAVRWPSTLKKPLKVAAAGHNPPLTMTEYLAKCFHEIQDEGGFRKRPSGTAAETPARNDKERRKRYQEASEKLFHTNDRRLIDLMISLLEHMTR